MKVRELIEALSQYHADSEVRIAMQPKYPVECTIKGVATHFKIDDIDNEYETSPSDIVYLTEGTQICYSSRDLWY